MLIGESGGGRGDDDVIGKCLKLKWMKRIKN